MYCRLEFRTGKAVESTSPYGAMFWFNNQYLEPESHYIFYQYIDLAGTKTILGEIPPSNDMLLGWVLNQFTGEGCVHDISIHEMKQTSE